MKNFGRKIKARFERRLKPAFDEFERVKEDESFDAVEGFEGVRLTYPTYRVLDSSKAVGYLLLRIEGDKEAFNTWIAVMPSRRRSPDFARHGLHRDDADQFGCRFPLCHLWGMANHDRWWTICDPEFAMSVGGYDRLHGFAMSPDACRAWIEERPDLYRGNELSDDDRILLPHVDQMIDCIIECGVPFFRSVAAGTSRSDWPKSELPNALQAA